MKKTYLIAIASLIASPALLADEDRFNALDIDKDGRISLEEASVDPALSALFSELDSDKDGYLTMQELEGKMDSHDETEQDH